MNRHAEMQVFVRAAEDGSFSAAARNLALTPSAVSNLIARMEDRLGVLLFRRSHRTIDLTPEGEAFCDAFYHAAQAAIEAVGHSGCGGLLWDGGSADLAGSFNAHLWSDRACTESRGILSAASESPR